MSQEPCNCCKDKKPGVQCTVNGYGYNRLDGEARTWAENNQFARSEYCVRVNGGKRFGGPDWVKNKCGDGRMGFSTRRKNQDKVKMESGLDGQFKRKRTTLVNKKSVKAAMGRRIRRIDGSRVVLVSRTQVLEAMRDPIVVAQQEKTYRAAKRAKNRNGRARRGLKRGL